jgi:autotransporter-associated beta strand protein
LLVLESAASAATYTWTGAGGANSNWANPANWGGSAPGNGETDVGLVFPALTGHYASSNDLSGLQVTSLAVTTQLSDGDYMFAGNPLTLNGPATMDSPDSGTPNLIWQIPVVLGRDVTVRTSGRQTQLQGPINLAGSTLTLDAEGDVVLAGVVSGRGSLVKHNGSALTITGTNTYSGPTTCNRGALYIASAAALGDTAAGTTFNGGFLGFVGGSQFATSEPIVFNGGEIGAYGTPSMAGQITLSTTIEVQVFEALATLTIGGTIVGPGGLSKTGPGLLILNAPGALYEGATAVENGTLQLDTDLSSPAPVTVQSAATLQGNGSSGGPISVQDGGAVAPGSSPGELSSTGLTLVAGATFMAEIEGPDPITQYDRMTVAGAVNLGGATLAVTLGYTPTDGEQFTLIAHGQGQAVAGTFADLAEGATFQVAGTTFGITYKGGSGSDVVLVAGPPHTPTPTATGLVPTSTPTTLTSHSATPTASLVPTPTATGMAARCTGDCDGNGAVAINELVIGVNIALDNAQAAVCPRFDTDGDDRVAIQELIEAVGNALTGCPDSP